MWKRLRALIIKEFIAIWQDKRSRMSLIMPPLVQFFIFTFAATLDVHNVSLGILNRDQGHAAYELQAKIMGSPEFSKFTFFSNEQELKRALDSQKVLAAICFQEDFSRKILARETAPVYLIADGRKSNSSQIVLGYLADIAGNYQAAAMNDAGIEPPRTELKPRNWYNANLNYTWFTISGLIGVISMLTSVSVTSLSIAREKEMGTYEQLLVSPLSPMEILIGKAIPALVIGVAEGSLMLLAGFIFLGLPVRGFILPLYLSMIVFIFAIVGMGLFISSLSRTQQQSTLGVFLCMSPLVILSGFATPIENMPPWLQAFAQLNPLKYFLIIVRGTCMKQISLFTVFNNTWPMLLIAVGTLSVSAWTFRKKIG